MAYQHGLLEKTWKSFREEQWLLYGVNLADWDPLVWERAGRGGYGVVHEGTSHARQMFVQELGGIKVGDRRV